MINHILSQVSLLTMMFLECNKRYNICYKHTMFLYGIKIFFMLCMISCSVHVNHLFHFQPRREHLFFSASGFTDLVSIYYLIQNRQRHLIKLNILCGKNDFIMVT